MLKLALELPTAKLNNWAPLLDLDFVLAHKVLQDPNYAEFFRLRNPQREVILDNSTHEFGKPLPFAELEKACRAVQANYLIAPDIVPAATEGKVTTEQFQQNLRWLTETAEYLDSSTTATGIAAVLCGNDVDEIDDYLDLCVQHSVDVLCFTFHNPNRLEWWHLFVEHDAFFTIDRIHLLGMHTEEELKKWVEISEEHEGLDFSFDTSKPLKFGVQKELLENVKNLRGGPVRSKEVLELTEFTEDQVRCCEENIRYLKAICRGEL